MTHYEDGALCQDDDLLALIEEKDAEIEALHDRLSELLGDWMFAERHGLTIADTVWIAEQKIEVRDGPDCQWELWQNGKRIQKADSVKKALEVVRCFTPPDKTNER